MAKKNKYLYIDTIEEIIENLGYKLVDYNLIYQGNMVKAKIDIHNPYGYISHKDCGIVSKHCEEFLIEKIDENIVLEVSSPGINRILKTERELKVFKGYEIELYFKKDFINDSNKMKKNLHIISGDKYLLIDYVDNILYVDHLTDNKSDIDIENKEIDDFDDVIKINIEDISKIKLLN